jgi:hypothetical protein
MNPHMRLDIVTASRVDLVLILLPTITLWDAAWSLAASGVPLEVAARVLALPGARRVCPAPSAAITAV